MVREWFAVRKGPAAAQLNDTAHVWPRHAVKGLGKAATRPVSMAGMPPVYQVPKTQGYFGPLQVNAPLAAAAVP